MSLILIKFQILSIIKLNKIYFFYWYAMLIISFILIFLIIIFINYFWKHFSLRVCIHKIIFLSQIFFRFNKEFFFICCIFNINYFFCLKTTNWLNLRKIYNFFLFSFISICIALNILFYIIFDINIFFNNFQIMKVIEILKNSMTSR